MTTASQAFAALRARVEDAGSAITLPLRWQNEDATPLPDIPAPFGYVDLQIDPAFIASYGGGAGQNRWRNSATLRVFVFVPRGHGLQAATDLAEQIAARYRGFRDASISCFDASVLPGGAGSGLKPQGIGSEVDNYYYAEMQASLFFDQIG